jgi:predicted nuclease of predicted toxin-antitoxin system
MKVLLDENLPVRLRLLIPRHEVFTVQYLGWKATKNGALLRRAAEHGFSVLISMDSGLEFQHDLAGLPLAIVLLRAPTNEFHVLVPLVDELVHCLDALQPCSFNTVPGWREQRGQDATP